MSIPNRVSTSFVPELHAPYGLEGEPTIVNGRAIPPMATYPGYLTSGYARDVAVNLPPDARKVPYGDFAGAGALVNILQNVVTAGCDLDEVKKLYFYGKQAVNRPGGTTMTVQEALDRAGISADVFHGIIGLVTESSELADALLAAVRDRNEELDEVNIKEEIGDCLWYLQTIATALGTTLEECAHINTAKLKKRYPDKFTEDAAINRDVAAERELLEQAAQKPSEVKAALTAKGDAERDPRLEVFTSGSELDS